MPCSYIMARRTTPPSCQVLRSRVPTRAKLPLTAKALHSASCARGLLSTYAVYLLRHGEMLPSSALLLSGYRRICHVAHAHVTGAAQPLASLVLVTIAPLRFNRQWLLFTKAQNVQLLLLCRHARQPLLSPTEDMMEILLCLPHEQIIQHMDK